MCGFASIINLDGLKRDIHLDNRMNAALQRLYPRGPNQQGNYVDENCYMVHSRLSIIDLSNNAKQPMIKYGKVIIFNGEIYNFKELRDKLISYGYKFKSLSDTEVLIAGWDKWGEALLNHIDGMYAFAIWDFKLKKLFLVRDPYGKKPLLYSVQKNTIAFASDLKSLRKIIDCGDINPLAVESLFKLRFIHDPLTIYKNSFKLPPGHLLKFDINGKKMEKWYRLPNPKILLSNKKDVLKNLRSLFDKAVERRLISDVSLGVLLSGGLDSSLIIASLAKQGKSIDSFTVGFEGKANYYEERPAASKLSNYFGIKHHQFEISSKLALSKFPEVFQASDEPFADSSALPFYMLSEEVSKIITVAISGDGGDEVFGGYRKHIGERWAPVGSLIPKFIRNYLSNLLSENKNTPYGEISRRLRRFLMNVSRDGYIRQAGWLEQLNEESIYNLLGNNLSKTENLLIEYRKNFYDPINAMLAGDLGFSLPGDMLVKLDRMSMANSLEVRSPFLDKSLVEYAFNIPGNWKIGMLEGKKILREAFKDRIPEWSLRLPKRGFEMPIANWLQTDLKKILEDVSSTKNLEKLGIVNHSIVEEWKANLYSRRRDTSWPLWTLISYKYWADSEGIL